jgi:ribosomal protein L37E
MAEAETSIIHCRRCGLRTRHELQRWQRKPALLYLVTGRIKLIEGWVCTQCGRRAAVSARFLPESQVEEDDGVTAE